MPAQDPIELTPVGFERFVRSVLGTEPHDSLRIAHAFVPHTVMLDRCGEVCGDESLTAAAARGA